MIRPKKLTEKQKERLLEMCDALFPIHEWHFWQSDDDDDNYPIDQYIGYPAHCNIGITNEVIIPALEIHWFEFCVLHLSKKVYSRSTVLNTKRHIVDYLYINFKALKPKS